MDENHSRYSILVSVLAGAIISYVICKAVITYPDGLKSAGFSSQLIQKDGKIFPVFIPIYMAKDAYDKLQETPKHAN